MTKFEYPLFNSNDYLYVHIWAALWQNQQNDCAPNEDSDQPGHLPSLIRAFIVRMKKAWVLSYQLSPQRRLWSDWADAQADLSLRWVHSHFIGFVTRQFISHFSTLPPGVGRLLSLKVALPRDLFSFSRKRIYWYWCPVTNSCIADIRYVSH